MEISKIALILVVIVTSFICCRDGSNVIIYDKNNDKQIKRTLNTLLNSIENKDIDSLKSTMSPTGKMELILPNSKITYSVDEFVELHENWFLDSTWTMETKILNIKAGAKIGTATTEAIYREPDRNGKPYMNHMIVSYVIEKESDNSWYVTKDHACSIKKSNDQ